MESCKLPSRSPEQNYSSKHLLPAFWTAKTAMEKYLMATLLDF